MLSAQRSVQRAQPWPLARLITRQTAARRLFKASTFQSVLPDLMDDSSGCPLGRPAPATRHHQQRYKTGTRSSGHARKEPKLLSADMIIISCLEAPATQPLFKAKRAWATLSPQTGREGLRGWSRGRLCLSVATTSSHRDGARRLWVRGEGDMCSQDRGVEA